MDYFRKINIDGKIIVSRSYDIVSRTIKRDLPKHLKRKQLFYDSKKNHYYYCEEIPVAKVKYLGAYKDRACTIKKKI